MKRLFDIIFSMIGLILLSPLFLYIAAKIKSDTSGPVFYRGLRVGRNGKLFRIYKFRSMVVDAEKIGPSSTVGDDTRITEIGHFVRKFKIDELPQLINVFLGDMSFVGPRPEVQKFVDLYTEVEKKILTVRPGITDWSSLKFPNEDEILNAHKDEYPDADEAYNIYIRPEKLRLQLEYVMHNSLWIDLQIIFKTIFSVIRKALK